MKRILRRIKRCFGDIRRSLLYYHIWPLAYRRAARAPVEENKALFVSGNFRTLPDNLRCMKREFESRGFVCEEVLAPGGRGFKRKLNEFKGNISFQRKYAQAAYVFVEDFFFPLYANQPRKGTRVVQLWHACGAFKKWGYSTADLSWGSDRKSLERYPIHNTYTDVTVSSESIIPFYAEAFNCPAETVRALGVPRTDVYFEEGFAERCRAELETLCPGIGGRKILLYAPTFRGNSTINSYMELKLDIARMARELSEEYALVLKLHPQTARRFTLSEEERSLYADFVFDVSNKVEAHTALGAADMLITDYSSVVFEYALLQRPMLFFAYDLEEYDRTRSFYTKYEDFVPGPIVRDTQELLCAVREQERGFERERMAAFKDQYMSACDGASSARIADALTRGEDDE